MNYRTLLMFVIGMCLYYASGKAQQRSVSGKNAVIIIEIELPEGIEKDRLRLWSYPFDHAAVVSNKEEKAEVSGNFMKCTLLSDRPLVVDLRFVRNNLVTYLCEPGDSIHIDFRHKKSVYSGNNASKFIMQQEMHAREKLLPPVKNPSFSKTESLEDYLEWDRYLNGKLDIMDSVLTLYKDRITTLAYSYLKADMIAEMEYERLMKFSLLIHKSTYNEAFGKQLAKVFDSTTRNKHAQWLHSYTGKVEKPHYFYDFVRRSIQRKYNFNTEHDDLEGAGRKIMYADFGKKIYSGEILQDFMVYLLTQEGLKEHIYSHSGDPDNNKIENLLDEFYKSPNYHTDRKAYVKDYERWIRQYVTIKGNIAPYFSFEDINGKIVNSKQFKGKTVLMTFLDTSKPDEETSNAIRTIQQAYDKNPNIALINISIEKDKLAWKKSLADTQYQVKDVINLYTNGLGTDHPLVRHYGVTAYPQFFLLNNRGAFLYNNEFYGNRGEEKKLYRLPNTLPDPRNDEGQAVINKIYEQLALMTDGPYVFHEKGGLTAYSIEDSKVAEQKYTFKNNAKLSGRTDDIQKNFAIQLKSKLMLEPSLTVSRPEKLFVLSDIEGEFEAFRKLLQANKVIDDNFNWVFGKGRLVFAGDMFDRGLQVTECLWLVYMLEEKAKVAGGYVHFVLGNHEIMNLQGDHRYVNNKYKDNAALMGKTLVQLYNEDTELGRWLRTKNIVEKIGDLLFMHGGFSQELNTHPLSVEQLNSVARPFYADSKAAENADSQVSQLYKSSTSPFWYRLYYKWSESRGIYKAKESQVDSTLQKFNVKHIITGHTIIADTISTHYNNKVINTDTRHRTGKSEALLIEGKNFYRVNSEGKRVLLFKEEEND